MTKILAVDDDAHYRDALKRILEEDGHEIVTATSGREAIDVGSRLRPELLLTDWMLADWIHGIHVSRALQAVQPELRTVLITGFPSGELESAATRAGISRLLEKPFNAAQLRSAVRETLGKITSVGRRCEFGVLEVDAGGSIVYTSPRAAELVSRATAGAGAKTLHDLFASDAETELEAAAEDWVTLRAPDGSMWRVHSQSRDRGPTRIAVLRPADGPADESLAEMLVGVDEASAPPWPLEGRTLVVEPDLFLRRVFASMLQKIHVPCHTAGSREEALHTLRRDPDIDLLVVDQALPGSESELLVREARDLVPGIEVVAHGEDNGEELGGGDEGSPADPRSALEAIGVRRFLRKPWTGRELVAVLSEED